MKLISRIKIIIFIFFAIFVFYGIKNISTFSLHDFDEANRAEAAKNMKRYRFYLFPLTGSPFHRVKDFKIKAENNPQLNLYYHLERPPLFYWFMILSTKVFGDNEIGYRLPSFFFGVFTQLIFIFNFHPLSSLSLLSSIDFWLSSQQALMDTSLSFFLFLSFLSLVKFSEKKQHKFLFLSSFFWSLAFLCKGQPSFIFIFPLIFLLIAKKIKIAHFFYFVLASFLILLPWLILVTKKFGLSSFFSVFLGFAQKRALSFDPTQQAPFFWYLRWFFESLRIGLILFLTLFVYDLIHKKIDWKKQLTLFYFFLSFLLFSFSKNKVWWYVIPLIPIIGFYINLSINDFIREKPTRLFNLSLIIFLSSVPFFYGLRNIFALIFIFLYVLISYLILRSKFLFKKEITHFSYFLSIIFALIIFFNNFPQVKPFYPELKMIGQYYQKLPQPKCLYLENMPYESALFYTDAEEVNYYQEKIEIKSSCQNYLLTPEKKNLPLIFRKNRLKLYRL